MNQYLDLKYLNILSPQLKQFKQKTPDTYNFRCPFCGDSEKSETLSRGYIYTLKGEFKYKCHNCGHPSNLQGLLKFLDPVLYQEYRLERYKDRNLTFATKVSKSSTKEPKKIVKKRTNLSKSPLGSLKTISQLKHDHPAKKYIVDRLIPNGYHYKLLYTSKFFAFVNSCIPNKFKETEYDEPRLIIPIIDSNGDVLGFQGRSFKNSKQKYITILFDKSNVKIYGLDTADLTKVVYVVEGPIDSMFLKNSIAMLGSSFAKIDKYDDTNFVYIYDNEPRNKEICKLMLKKIRNGDSIVIWPDDMLENDINDMVLAGMAIDRINSIVETNTYRGLHAQIRFNAWKKCELS